MHNVSHVRELISIRTFFSCILHRNSFLISEYSYRQNWKFSLPLVHEFTLGRKNILTPFIIETSAPTTLFINISLRGRVLLNLHTLPLNDIAGALLKTWTFVIVPNLITFGKLKTAAVVSICNTMRQYYQFNIIPKGSSGGWLGSSYFILCCMILKDD